jgi:hypothetical protein
VSTFTIEGRVVSDGSITIPFFGAWVGDVSLPVQDPPLPDSVAVVVGDLTLRGTVVRQAGFAGGRKARIVAGGGGWGKTIPSKGYSHVIGVKASTILGDAARACGESIVLDSDSTLGTSYAREEAPAERCLRLLVGDEWWIDNDGVTQTKARESTAVVAPFTLVSRDGALDRFEIATESIAGWLPGRTFTSPTVIDPQTISSVTIEAGNDGKLRLHVLGTSVARERLRRDIRAIIRAEIASLSYLATWDYTVAASLGMPGISTTVDLTPASGSPMPSLTNVPLAIDLHGVSAPIAGTTARVRFVNGNPAKPEVIALGGSTEHYISAEATILLIYNTLATLMNLAGGGPLLAVVLQPLLGTAMTAALAAQVAPAPPGLIPQIAAAAALQAGFATGVAPSPAMFAAWTAALAGLDTKIPNVSGAFPSLGVPK